MLLDVLSSIFFRFNSNSKEFKMPLVHRLQFKAITHSYTIC